MPPGCGRSRPQLRSTVDEVGRVCEAESIDCDFVKGGTPFRRDHRRPSSPGCAPGSPRIREWGDGDDVYQFLSGEETARADQRRGGPRRPLRARERADPAGRARGRASPRRRSGAVCEIYEATPVTRIEPADASSGAAAGAVARTKFGDVRARSVLRCTEGYTAALPGLRRALLPMNSHMVVTEPLGDAAWQEIGWDGLRDAGRRGARVHVRAADRGRQDRARRARRPVPVRLGHRPPGDDRPVHGGRAHPGAAADVPRRRERRGSSTPGAACSACPATGARRSPTTPRRDWAGRAATPGRGSPRPTSPGAPSPTW